VLTDLKEVQMARMKSPRRLLGIVLLSVALVPAAAFAYTVCQTYNDGCTICDMYSEKGEYRGYIEWCH